MTEFSSFFWERENYIFKPWLSVIIHSPHGLTLPACPIRILRSKQTNSLMTPFMFLCGKCCRWCIMGCQYNKHQVNEHWDRYRIAFIKSWVPHVPLIIQRLVLPLLSTPPHILLLYCSINGVYRVAHREGDTNASHPSHSLCERIVLTTYWQFLF